MPALNPPRKAAEAWGVDGPNENPATPGEGALCRLHMRRYDGNKVSGCPVCLGEEPEHPEEPKSGFGKWALVAAAVVFVGLVMFRGSPESSETEVGPKLKAHPYRIPIEAIEDVIFAERVTSADGASLVKNSSRLARDIKEWESRLSLLGHVKEIQDFGRFVETASADGFDMIDQQAARAHWVALRDRAFEPSDWFRSTALN